MFYSLKLTEKSNNYILVALCLLLTRCDFDTKAIIYTSDIQKIQQEQNNINIPVIFSFDTLSDKPETQKTLNKINPILREFFPKLTNIQIKNNNLGATTYMHMQIPFSTHDLQTPIYFLLQNHSLYLQIKPDIISKLQTKLQQFNPMITIENNHIQANIQNDTNHSVTIQTHHSFLNNKAIAKLSINKLKQGQSLSIDLSDVDNSSSMAGNKTLVAFIEID
ncbi:MAG: hypothetical protein H8E74_11310 [Gammaproteobacteria bacterium]|nr:hypothetical protein [Gammaproteobacteria bacterium]